RDVRKVDALTRCDRAADFDGRDDVAVRHLVDAQADGAIRQVCDITRLDDLGEAAPLDGQLAGIPQHHLRRQYDAAAHRQLADAVLDRADAQLRARDVLQDADLATHPPGRGADHLY